MISSLRRWNFFNHDTRHGIPTSMTISETMCFTLAYPEAHTYVTFRYLVTVAFNMAVTMGVDCGRCSIINSFNGRWFCTLCAIECKIPSTASITAIRTYISFVEHTERGIVIFFVKNTVLLTRNRCKMALSYSQLLGKNYDY